ncbi:MAG: hypothetical protein AABW90_02575 [Nanoarchaeota archaeon]
MPITDLLKDPTILSSFSFLILVIAIIYYTLYQVLKNVKKPLNKNKFFLIASIILIIWFFTVVFLGKTDFFAKSYYYLFVPNIVIAFLILFHFLRMAYNSKIIQTVTDKIPQHLIIGVQTYRTVGVGFIILYFQGLLPAVFAFSAGIGDIIIGVTAPFVAVLYYLKKPYSRKLAILWNYLGILDLIIALSVGFLGFSKPVQFIPLNPSTEPLSLFPLVIIPLFVVPLDILLHLFSLRVLRSNN